MSELFNTTNIYKIIIALIVLAMGYMFNMILDTKHSLYLSNQAQDQNKRQWQYISGLRIDMKGVKTDIEWLKKK